MDDPPAAAPAPERARPPRALGRVALAVALGLAAAGAYWAVSIKPARAIAERRFRTHQALMRLYTLQMSYRADNGVFANDLESLIASAPDRDKIRADLHANADFATLAIVGNTKRFRLEANILDPERTLIKLRGPTGAR